MSLAGILSKAQSVAALEIETVRGQVVLLIQGSPSFTGAHGASLRARIKSTVSNYFDHLANRFAMYIADAWEAGIHRARHPELPSNLPRDYEAQVHSMDSGFDHLGASISNDLIQLLTRASVTGWTKQQVIDKVGSGQASGVFKQYQARAYGILEHAVHVTESTAHARRAREIAQIKAQPIGFQKAKQLLKKGLHPLTIKVWRHSHGGNPPRYNHLAFDGKGVVVDMKFKLTGRDGNIYLIDGPHDMVLPAEEVINCHCMDETTTIDVTDEEEAKIREKSESTGGFTDPRWT